MITKRQINSLECRYTKQQILRAMHSLVKLEDLETHLAELQQFVAPMSLQQKKALKAFNSFNSRRNSERIKQGLDRARERGSVLGRPRIPAEKEQEILELLNEYGIRKTARMAGVGVGTVQRLIKEQL